MVPGAKVGAYVVEAQIGTGGMAAVYRIRDDAGAAWALKVLSLRKPEIQDRFRLEAEIQMRLDHPNIVRGWELVDVDPPGGGGPTLGLRMDLVDGPPLDQWLLDHPETTLAAKDRMARQIVEAVAHAHVLGVVHRDLKPSNVLVELRDGEPWPRVSDFGLAKQITGHAATRTGIALGTPRYMAPEQVRDAKRVDARADVWSLGVLLYEMYTGKPAFHRAALIDVFTAVVEGRYADPAVHGAPPRVRDAIVGALQVDPERRFPDCAALLVALACPTSPGQADGVATDTICEPPAAPGQAASPSSAPTELVGAITGVTLAPPSDPGPAAPTPRPRPRAGGGFPVRMWIAAWIAAFALIVVAFGGGLALFGGAVTVRAILGDDPPARRP